MVLSVERSVATPTGSIVQDFARRCNVSRREHRLLLLFP
jgi:hypothetical protein